MGVNSLPKTVTRERRSCDLNPGPSVPESSTLTTRLPSHPSCFKLLEMNILFYASERRGFISGSLCVLQLLCCHDVVTVPRCHVVSVSSIIVITGGRARAGAGSWPGSVLATQ